MWNSSTLFLWAQTYKESLKDFRKGNMVANRDPPDLVLGRWSFICFGILKESKLFLEFGCVKALCHQCKSSDPKMLQDPKNVESMGVFFGRHCEHLLGRVWN